MSVQLSLKHKLGFFPALASIWVSILCALVTGLSNRRAKTWYLHIAYAALRTATKKLSPLQLQYALSIEALVDDIAVLTECRYISPSTGALYTQYMKKTKQTPQTVKLGDSGGHGHWIGSPNASHVLIWYHGGGFGLPANRGYFKFFARLLADAERANKSLAVFCLGYTLAPHAQYPTQLRQAVEALRHVLKDHRPENVLLGGDSAGGNLVGGVLSHLAHTHPEIKPVELSGCLKGAVLLSPWTSLDTEFPGHEIDSSGDLITESVAEPWSGAYLGSAKRDFYTDLSTAPAEWYAAFPVESLLICAGGTEIMYPMLEDLVKRMREGRTVEFVVGERECHVAPIYHLYVGENRETEQGKRVKSWLRECI